MFLPLILVPFYRCSLFLIFLIKPYESYLSKSFIIYLPLSSSLSVSVSFLFVDLFVHISLTLICPCHVPVLFFVPFRQFFMHELYACCQLLFVPLVFIFVSFCKSLFFFLFLFVSTFY